MLLTLGSNLETREQVFVEYEASRRVLICGKTGTGKSYTLGVMIEELGDADDVIPIVVDPQGIFWSMAQENEAQEFEVFEYGGVPTGYEVNLLVPGDPIEQYGSREYVDELESRGIHVNRLSLNPSDISPEMWLGLLGLDINELQGITLYSAIRACRKRLKNEFFLSDIAEAVVSHETALDQTKEAVLRKLDMASDWDLFEELTYRSIWDVIHKTAINVLDLSTLFQNPYGLRNLIVGVFAKYLFRERVKARRLQAVGLAAEMPKIWLAIDEAHNFCPAGRSTLSKSILIQWAKEGRQPGLSLVVASQQPSAIDAEVLTQCDLKIVHRLTSKNDRRAVNALSEDYVEKGLTQYWGRLKNPGQAVLIDDLDEKVTPVQVRPRYSNHGGWSA